MGLIASLLWLVLTVFILLMLARLVLDWVVVLGGGSTSSGGLVRVREFTHSATEPVIAPVRKALKPVRIGGFSLDLAFTAVFIVALILQSVFASL